MDCKSVARFNRDCIPPFILESMIRRHPWLNDWFPVKSSKGPAYSMGGINWFEVPKEFLDIVVPDIEGDLSPIDEKMLIFEKNDADW